MYIYVANVPQGFLYSETTNYVLYIISLVFFCAYTLGLQCGMVIPSLITGERILTIFFPLKNNFILTRRRKIIAVWFLYIVNGGFFVYQYILCRQFKHFIVEGVAVSGFMYTDIYIHDVRSGLYTLIRRVVNYMTGLIPICLVTVGSVAIGIQLVLITKRRKELTRSQVKVTTNGYRRQQKHCSVFVYSISCVLVLRFLLSMLRLWLPLTRTFH